jgi:hypothetical protein
MKNLLFSLLVVLNSLLSFAQDGKYNNVMQGIVTQLDSAINPSTIQSANNTLERVAMANPKEWLPQYYQAYCNIMLGMRQEENAKKDEYYDKAESVINHADSISPNNSEIYVMKAFVTSMKISVDPSTRGQKYGMLASTYILKAIDLDKENPRAYFLRGQGLIYTPAQFGGGPDKALPVLESAVEKFKTFKPASPIMPHWGEAKAKEALTHCKSMLENGK